MNGHYLTRESVVKSQLINTDDIYTVVSLGGETKTMTNTVRVFEYIDQSINHSVRSTGWRLQEATTFDPMPVAYGVTHDVLEHFEADDAGIEQEMQAFGSIYHIRIRGGWWKAHGSVAACKMLAWDMARFSFETNFTIKTCETRHSNRLDNFQMKAFPFYLEWLEKRHGINNSHPDMVKAILAFEQACHWMSVGYDRSLVRWKGHTPQAICNLFNRITDAVTNVMGAHGDLLKITFDTVSLNASVVKA